VSLNGTIESINRNRTAGALPYRVLFCKYDKRKSLHRLTVEQVRAAFPTYDTIIRDNVALGEAPAANADIFSYAPRSYGAQDYTAFVAEYVRTYRIRHLRHKH
jgi:chromosome partitioning protein